jgi:ribosomal protein L18
MHGMQAYRRVPLEDRLSESLFPIVEDEALAFIERARADHPACRVLVHCVLGKSRSASAVVAYLVRHRGMTLRQAYLHVLEQRKAVVVVRPNRSFVAQLMAWEVTTTMTTTTSVESTLSWDDVDTGCADFRAWLADASLKTPLSGSRSKKGGVMARIVCVCVCVCARARVCVCVCVRVCVRWCVCLTR